MLILCTINCVTELRISRNRAKCCEKLRRQKFDDVQVMKNLTLLANT